MICNMPQVKWNDLFFSRFVNECSLWAECFVADLDCYRIFFSDWFGIILIPSKAWNVSKFPKGKGCYGSTACQLGSFTNTWMNKFSSWTEVVWPDFITKETLNILLIIMVIIVKAIRIWKLHFWSFPFLFIIIIVCTEEILFSLKLHS